MNGLRGCHGAKPYLTAYEIALRHGFTGSEEEWIRSIGTMRCVHVTGESGGTFTCDASLGQVRQMLADGFIPVLITVEGLPAFLSDVTGEVLSFSTGLIRDIDGDYYDCYSMSGREYTVQKMTVSGSEGGGGSIGPGSITFSLLNERLQEAVQSAESAVQPEDVPVIKGYASAAAYQADDQNVRVGDYVLITDSSTAKLYRKGSDGLTLLYTFPEGESGGTIEDGSVTIYKLASDVQQSIHRADTAMQPGTVILPSVAQSTTAGGTVPKTAALEDYEEQENSIILVHFTTPVEANATLSITPDDGETYLTARAIYNKGLAITRNVIGYNATAAFVFDGTHYNLLFVDNPTVRQTDIVKLTVTFTEYNGEFAASATLAQVFAALEDNKKVDCAFGDYHGELIYAHEDDDPDNDLAIFKITESLVTYQDEDGVERYPQVWMYYLSNDGLTVSGTAVGGTCYVLVTEDNGVWDIDTENSPKTAQSVTGLLTAFYAGVETRLIAYSGYYRWCHPVSFTYGQTEIRFAGPEAVTVNGVTELRIVEYTVSAQAAHITRTVKGTVPVPASGTALDPSTDAGKVPTVNDYGGYELTAPQTLPAASGSDQGKVVSVNASGEYVLSEGTDSTDAEAYAAGTRGGDAVASGDPAYHNNAYYYASQISGAIGVTLKRNTGVNLTSASAPYNDLNTFPENEIVYCLSGATSSHHSPTSKAFMVYTVRAYNNATRVDQCKQQFLLTYENEMWYRCCGTSTSQVWGDWIRIPNKDDTIYLNKKAAFTTSSMSGTVYADLNTFPANESADYVNMPANAPTTLPFQIVSIKTYVNATYTIRGTLQVVVTNADSTGYGNLYFRRCYGSGSTQSWSSWAKMPRETDMLRVHSEIITASNITGTNYADINTLPDNEIVYYNSSTGVAHSPVSATSQFMVATINANRSTSAPYNGKFQFLVADKSEKLIYLRNYGSDAWLAWQGIRVSKLDEVEPRGADIFFTPYDIQPGDRATFFGDSITYGTMSGGYDEGETAGTNSHRYVKVLAQMLGITAYNFGVVGACWKAQTGVTDIKSQLQTALASVYDSTNQYNKLHDVDHVFIAAGTNDYDKGTAMSDLETALEDTFDYLDEQYGGPVTIILPIGRIDPATNYNKPFGAYVNCIFAHAVAHGYNVIDGGKFGFPTEANAGNEILCADGVHPTKAGHRLMAQQINNRIMANMEVAT